MSNPDAQSLVDDVSFLKKLAADGRGKPAPMAALLTGFGLIYGLMCLYQAYVVNLVLTGSITRESMGNMLRIPTLGANALFLILLAGCGVYAWRKRGTRAKLNGAAAAAWTAAALSLIVIIASFLLMMKVNTNIGWGLNVVPSIALTLWASAWLVSATATGQKYLYAVAAGSFVFALAWAGGGGTIADEGSGLPLFNGASSILSFIGLSFLLLAFVPGVILLRKGQA